MPKTTTKTATKATTKATTKTTTKPKGWARRAKGGGDQACSVAGCKRAYRAKGYCYFHFKKWRQGDLPHSRYRTCSKAECRLKAVRHGLCEKHEAETYRKGAETAA